MNEEGFWFPGACCRVVKILMEAGEESMAADYIEQVMDYGLYHTVYDNGENNILEALMIMAREIVDEENDYE